ncbi:MAG: universal stress protein [Acidimicrobiales bacterium]|jgi:nucleotide-binding universal stress UspA family protein
MNSSEQAADMRSAHLGHTTGRVVVGVDGSPRSLEALRWAADIARWRNWTLHLVGVWHVAYATSPFAIDYGEIGAAAKDETETLLNHAEKEVLGDDPSLDVRLSVGEGSPAQVLVAASDGADLLVVGSRGLGGFSSLALGSVGQACVHHAHCPVLIIRPKTREVVE